VLYSKAKHQLSSRRACRLFSLRTSVFYYQKVRKDEDDNKIIVALTETDRLMKEIDNVIEI